VIQTARLVLRPWVEADAALIAFAERVGFRRESGRLRERLLMPNGRFADGLVFGVLRGEV
jgi:RimJ/RimL family protein N-acetyltransferase